MTDMLPKILDSTDRRLESNKFLTVKLNMV